MTKTIMNLTIAMMVCGMAVCTFADSGNFIIYVDDGGSDSTGDGSYDNPYATIQKAVDEVPDVITKHYTISVDNGTYREQVDIINKVVAGPNASLTIIGDTVTNSNVRVTGSDSGADTTAVREVGFYVKRSNVSIKGFLVNYCGNIGIWISSNSRGIVDRCTSSNNDAAGISADKNSDVDITNCTTNSNGSYGIVVQRGAYGYIYNTDCSSNTYGIAVRDNATSYADGNSSTTANTQYGIYAYYGGMAAYVNTTPTGQTQNVIASPGTYGYTY